MRMFMCFTDFVFAGSLCFMLSSLVSFSRDYSVFQLTSVGDWPDLFQSIDFHSASNKYHSADLALLALSAFWPQNPFLPCFLVIGDTPMSSQRGRQTVALITGLIM